MPKSALFISLLLTSGAAFAGLDVRGEAPFQTFLEDAPYPEYGSVLLRCDDGACSILKLSFLCDKEKAFVSQAAVSSDRIRLLELPTPVNSTLALSIDDFGTEYRCDFKLALSAKSTDNTLHVESYVCKYKSAWHDGKQKVERSVERVDLKRQCGQLLLERSPW